MADEELECWSWNISECRDLQWVRFIALHQLGYPWLPAQSGHPGKRGLHINCLGHGSAAVQCNSLERILSPHPAFLIWTPLFVGWQEISLTSGSNQMHPPHLTGHGYYQNEAKPLKFQKKSTTLIFFGELFRIEKANYLSFESWGWHGAHIFASTGLASWMNSEFPRENIFWTESQPCVQCLVCCVFALYVCFVFVLSICNLCFAFYSLFLLFVLCFCVCTWYLPNVFSWCLYIVFVFGILIGVPACLCFVIVICVVYSYIVFILFVCACSCFVLVICICFVFVICALCIPFVFVPALYSYFVYVFCVFS